MSADLVERLRNWTHGRQQQEYDLMREAATALEAAHAREIESAKENMNALADRDEKIERLRRALEEMLKLLDRHAGWCGYNKNAPGDNIINRAPKLAREALASGSAEGETEEVERLRREVRSALRALGQALASGSAEETYQKMRGDLDHIKQKIREGRADHEAG